MENSPNQDTELTNFLRQNRSIAPPELPELEDRLMANIDLLSTESKDRISWSWQRYLLGGIGLIVTGFVGTVILQIVNPPEPSIAELNQLNFFLEAHLHDLSNQIEIDTNNHENLIDLDIDLF
jgi:hypothetical protein